jgi:hypothetical protein
VAQFLKHLLQSHGFNDTEVPRKRIRYDDNYSRTFENTELEETAKITQKTEFYSKDTGNSDFVELAEEVIRTDQEKLIE